MKNVVVVGLSWAGAKAAKELAKSLPATHRVIAICPYDYAYHTVGALRAAVQPGWETSTPVPLDRLLSGRHVVLRGLVTAVNGESIAVDRDTEGFGSQIPFDALVLATGARYGFPARPPKDVTSVDQALDLLRRFQGEVKAAKSVLIIGGGAVGVEFAGEVAAEYPTKQITLVHAHDRLHLAQFKPTLHTTLLSQLERLGVKVLLHTRLDKSDLKTGPIEPRIFDLGNGDSVQADFVLVATGNTPDTDLVRALSPDLIDDKGLARVKPTLQLDSPDPALARIFVVGDASNVKESKLAYYAETQAAHAAHNVVALLAGRALKDYGLNTFRVAFVTLGPRGGATQIGWLVFGASITSMIKSKNLFVSMFRSAVGYKD